MASVVIKDLISNIKAKAKVFKAKAQDF